MEKSAIEKHSGLSQKFANNYRKNFITLAREALLEGKAQFG
jgi:hypothetical protein